MRTTTRLPFLVHLAYNVIFQFCYHPLETDFKKKVNQVDAHYSTLEIRSVVDCLLKDEYILLSIR
jgi:hypothetical protein